MGSPSSKSDQPQMQFSYKLISQTNDIKIQICMAIAINFNNTLLIAASKNDIKVILIKRGQLYFLKQLQKHHKDVTTLNFFKSKHQFISGSSDQSIILWSTNLIQNPKFLIKLQKHTNQITCLEVCIRTDQLFISGSKDKKIKFWCQTSKNSCFFSWNCFQTISEHTDQIYGLSLNQDGNKLISCGRDGNILIIEQSINGIWEIKQKLPHNFGFRLSFITNEMFAFQPLMILNHQFKASQSLILYSYNQISGCFVKSKEIDVKGVTQWCHIYFPQKYIPSKQILMSKNGQSVNLIRFTITENQNKIQDYHLDQVIDFNLDKLFQGYIFGTMSDNGDLLILWDYNSQKVKVRQFSEEIGKLETY